MKKRYMHTLDGRPATMGAEQIVFVDQLPNWQDDPYPARLRSKLSQIKRDQQRTIEFRKKCKFKDNPPANYGWVIVYI